jgi:hypothetical protein
MTVTFADVRKPILNLSDNLPGGSFRLTPLIKDIEFSQFGNYVMFGEEIP